MQSHFVERIAGHYLNKRNQDREAWGRSWEQQRRTQDAARKLDEEASESAKLRARTELVSSFGELFDLLPEGQGVPVSPAKFVELYLTLPITIRQELIRSTDLMKLYRGDDWLRASVWRKGDQITIYLIGGNNRMIQSVSIKQPLTKTAEEYGKTIPGMLSDNPAFNNKIYLAERFFTIFKKFPEYERNAIFTDPDIMLKLPRQVVRVGIHPLAGADEFSVIAFEAESFSGTNITTYIIPTASLARLKWKLTWDKSDTSLIPKEVDK
ncbi:MAG: hypothetical protein P9X24_03625 [Candidatus Hatepunaea meridiana]|nr:hypothetical protein [Candidatus Hatepunaea meridiana]